MEHIMVIRTQSFGTDSGLCQGVDCDKLQPTSNLSKLPAIRINDNCGKNFKTERCFCRPAPLSDTTKYHIANSVIYPSIPSALKCHCSAGEKPSHTIPVARF